MFNTNREEKVQEPNEDWYYEENGVPLGPVSEAELTGMFRNRDLEPETQIWTSAYGSQWKTASQTHLYAAAPPLGPPPLPARPTAAPVVSVERTSRASPLAGQLSQLAPSSKYAKLIAFSPLIILVLQCLLLMIESTTGYRLLNNAILNSIAFLVVVFLAIKDTKFVGEAGFNPKNRNIVPFIILTPAAYFWRRAAVTGTSYKFIWIWLSCFIITIIAVTVLESLTLEASNKNLQNSSNQQSPEKLTIPNNGRKSVGGADVPEMQAAVTDAISLVLEVEQNSAAAIQRRSTPHRYRLIANRTSIQEGFVVLEQDVGANRVKYAIVYCVFTDEDVDASKIRIGGSAIYGGILKNVSVTQQYANSGMANGLINFKEVILTSCKLDS